MQQLCLIHNFHKASVIIALFEICALLMHLLWLLVPDSNPFNYITDRTNVFIIAVDFFIYPANELSKVFSVCVDAAEFLVCLLLLGAIKKKIFWMTVPYLIKSLLYTLLGTCVVVLYVLRVFLLQEKQLAQRELEQRKSICIAFLALLVTGYCAFAGCVVLVTSRKIKREQDTLDITRNAVALVF